MTRLFQIKKLPPPIWNACDFALHFSFTIAHIPGKMNTAAAFFYHVQRSILMKNVFLKPEKVSLRNQLKSMFNQLE